jgi:uncharacterized protein (TIGR02266 family)
VSSADDRRRDPREHLTLKVEYADAGELVSDYTENISAGGTFVLTDRELPEGAEVKLVLSFPGLLRPLPLAGKVKWTRSGDDATQPRGIGIAFDRSDDNAVVRLDEIVGRIAAGDPELVVQTLQVLVVEDNPHVATLIREGLKGSARRELGGRVSFDCHMAANGRDALTRIRSQPFDIVIVDIYLPILDGAQLIAQVRADEALRHLPIVAVSGGGQAARDAALAAGADFFIDKPMRLADIFATMRRLMNIG